MIFVYGLIDPRTGELRYVGQTINGMDRATAHWRRKSIRNHRDRCHTWVRKLLSLELTPRVEILEECLAEELNIIERFWIASILAAGGQLLNMTDGGEGTHGFHWSDEARKRIGEHHRGKRLSAEHLTALSVANKGKKLSAEHRAKIGAAHRGRIWGPDFRAKISATSKGRVPWNKKVRNEGT